MTQKKEVKISTTIERIHKAFSDRKNNDRNEIILEKMRVGNKGSISLAVVSNLEVRTFVEPLYSSMLISMMSHVWTEELDNREKTISFKYPRNWWEHLKCSFPSWFKTKFPIKYDVHKRKVVFSHKTVYPQLCLSNIKGSKEMTFKTECREDYHNPQHPKYGKEKSK